MKIPYQYVFIALLHSYRCLLLTPIAEEDMNLTTLHTKIINESLEQALISNNGEKNQIFFIDNDNNETNLSISQNITIKTQIYIKNIGSSRVDLIISSNFDIQSHFSIINFKLFLNKNANFTISQANMTIQNCEISVFDINEQIISLFYTFSNSQLIFESCFIGNIYSLAKPMALISAFTNSEIIIQNFSISNLDISHIQILSADEANIQIKEFFIKDITNLLSDSVLTMFSLRNSEFILENLMFYSSFSKYSFISAINNDIKAFSRNIKFINCTFYEISSIAKYENFISIQLFDNSELLFQEVKFSGIFVENHVISVISTQTAIFFYNLTFFNVTCWSSLYISDSFSVILENILFLSNNFENLLDYDSTAIILENTHQKTLENIIIMNCSSYQTTVGIKIIVTYTLSKTKQNIKTLIKNSYFANNRVIYSKEKQTAVVLYISSDDENVLIENSYFLLNLIIPLTQIDQIGSPCLRAYGENLNLLVNYSIFKKNQAVFGSNCIFIDGFSVELSVSLFEENTNFIQPKDKYVIETFGYGGSLLTISENLMVNLSFFIKNMNYFGGNLYINGNLFRSKTTISINNSVFINNYSHSFGAGIYLADSLKFLISNFTNNLFFYNWGNYNGGGAHISFSSKSGYTYFENNDFIENWADFGPALNYDSQIGFHYIYNCRIFNNTASFSPRDLNKFSFSFPANGGSGGGICIIVKQGPTNPNIFSENNSFIDNFAICKGGVLASIGGNFSDKNSLFLRNSAGKVGCFRMHINSFLNLFNSSIRENSGILSFSCIMLSDDAAGVITNTKFQNCYGEGNGLLTVEREAKLTVFNCSFENISANIGTILSVKINSNNFVYFVNNYFDGKIQNKYSHEIFRIETSNNVIFENNSIEFFQGRLFTVINSEIILRNNIVNNIQFHENFTDFIIVANDKSIVFLEKVLFRNVLCSSLAVISIANTNFSIKSCEFFNLTNIFGGVSGIISAVLSNITIFSTIFQIIFSNILYLERTSSLINQTIFENSLINRNKLFSLYNLQAKSIVFSFSFIQAVDPSEFYVNFSHFSGNSEAINGSAIDFICKNANMFPYIVNNSSFFNNSAISYGGAIQNRGCLIDLIKNEFKENSAIYGGGFYSSSFYQANLQQNDFSSNHAFEGGAIKYVFVNPNISNSNKFSKNSAIYGTNIASFPTRLDLFEYLQTNNLNEIVFSARPSYSDSIFKNFSLYVVDELNQKVSTLNDSVFTINLLLNKNLTTKSNAQAFRFFLSGETKISIQQGEIFLNKTYFSAHLNETLLLDLCSKSIKTSNFQLNFTSYESIDSQGLYHLTFPLRILPCEIGEIFDEILLICVACPSGKFSFDPKKISCELCPKEAEYCYASLVYLKTGYWRADPTSLNIHECLPFADSCLGGKDSACAEGYRGPLCQSCDVSDKVYSKYFGIQCLECSSSKIAILAKLFVGSLFLIGFYILVIISNIKLIDDLQIDPVSKKIKEQSLEKFYPPIYNKILVNYLQIISLIKELDLDWPGIISDFFQMHYMAGNAPAYLYSFDCLMSKNSMIPLIYLKTILISITPWVAFALLKIFWIFYSKYTKKNMDSKYFTSRLVMFNLFLPTVVNISSKILICKDIEGVKYVYSDLFYECSSEENLMYSLAFAAPSVLIWTIIYPMMNLFILIRNKKILTTEDMRKKYGYLYNSYKTRYFYWEFVEIYKKYLLIIIIWYTQVKNEEKALIIMFFIYFCSYFQAKKFPYINKKINKLAFIGDIVSLSTLFFGLFSFSVEKDSIKYLTIFLIFAGNIYFLGYFTINVLSLYAKKVVEIIKNYPILVKFFNYFAENKKKTGGKSSNILDSEYYSKKIKDKISTNQAHKPKFVKSNDVQTQIIHLEEK